MDPRHFPTFDELPTDGSDGDTPGDEFFYDTPEDDGWVPSRQWCLLAEITDIKFRERPFLHIQVKDRAGKLFMVSFQLENETDNEREGKIDDILGRIKKGRSVAILHAEQHLFEDDWEDLLPLYGKGTHGLKLREGGRMVVFDMPLHVVITLCNNLFHYGPEKCAYRGCGSQSKTLDVTCNKCLLRRYCRKGCEKNDWIEGHKKECKPENELRVAFDFDWNTFSEPQRFV